jgi:hypothetical protein
MRVHLVRDTTGVRGTCCSSVLMLRKFTHDEDGVTCFSNMMCEIKVQCFCAVLNNSKRRIIIVRTAHR